MTSARRAVASSRHVPRLKLYAPTPPVQEHVLYWRVNGSPFRVSIWSDAEWSELDDRPLDAQHLDCGLWCAIRFED